MLTDRLRSFIVEEVWVDGREQDLADDTQLIETHIVDSVGLLHLVSFIEDEFGVQVADEELVPENFGTIGRIARLVEAKAAVR